MGSRKNYKASVEVGWSVPLDFFFVCYLCLFHIFHPTCGLSSCAIFGHSCTCVVVSNWSLCRFLQQNNAPQRLSQHQWTNGTYCFTQNRKQNHCPRVHSQKVRTSRVLWLTGSEFFMLMRKSEGSTPLTWKPFVWSRKLQTGLLPEVLTLKLSSLL